MAIPGILRTLARRFASAGPALAAALLGAAVVATPIPVVERARDLVFDEYQRRAPRPWSPDLPVRIVAIDEATLAVQGQWPWPRETMAELARKIAALGPAAIAFDIVFSEPDRLSPVAILERLPASPERDALAAALRARGELDDDGLATAIAAAPTILAQVFANDPTVDDPEVKANFVTLGDDPAAIAMRFRGAIAPLPALRSAATGLGAINFTPDRDLIIRRAPLVLSSGQGAARVLAPSLAVEALRIAQMDPARAEPPPSPIVKSTGASLEPRFGGRAAIVSVRVGDFEIPTDADGQTRVRFSGHRPERIISADAIMKGDVERAEIDGRIILVGVTATSLGDIRSTPIDAAVPGVEVHAELIEHAITGARLKRPDFALGLEAFAAFAGALLAILFAARFRPAISGLSIITLVAAAGYASWRAFTDLAMLYDAALPAAVWLVAWAVSTVEALRRSENERRFVRHAFSRYLAPAVVERLAADPKSLRLGGEAREVTVLFCDARNFTNRAESLTPEGVVRFLNSLLTPLTAEILASGGAVDKYMGDGLMAYWNAPLDTPDHASRACRAALAMLGRVPAVDAEAAAFARAENRPHAAVAIGIGLNTGRAFVGNMGSEQRFDYSLVGDTVNVAARLEAASKELGAPIVVSEETRAAARGFRFVPLGAIALKGRDEAAVVHALHGDAAEPEPQFEDFLTAHNAVLDAAGDAASVASAIVAARRFPQSARYDTLYRRIEQSVAASTPDAGKRIGGS